MTLRRGADQTLADRKASIKPPHLGRRARLIDEHQLIGLEIDLGVKPGLPPAKSVRPLLFGGVRFEAMGAIVATSCVRSKAAGASLLINPFDRGRGRGAEKLRRRTPRHPDLNPVAD